MNLDHFKQLSPNFTQISTKKSPFSFN